MGKKIILILSLILMVSPAVWSIPLQTQYLRIEFYESAGSPYTYDILEEMMIYDLNDTKIDANNTFQMAVTQGKSYNWSSGVQTFSTYNVWTYGYWHIFDEYVPSGTTNGGSYALTYYDATANRSQMVIKLNASQAIDIGKIEILRNTSQYSWHGQAKVRVYALSTSSIFSWDNTYDLSGGTMDWNVVADFNTLDLGLSTQGFDTVPEPSAALLAIFGLLGLIYFRKK